MKEVTYEDWQKNPTPRMMWVWNSKGEDKVKAKVIHILSNDVCIYPILTVTDIDDDYETYKHCAEIEEPKNKANDEVLYTPTQQKIKDVLEGMKNLLLYKNRKYGDSAINPKKIFYKGDSTNSILIRLDDKLGRVMSNTEEKPRVNDVADIIGYCTLLLIGMGVTSEDLKKFMD